MKILIIESAGHETGLKVTLVADSAIAPRSMPLFVPDFARWKVQWLLAFRVGRLGKTISPKFAPRYIDGVTVAARLVNDSALDPGIAACADYTVSMGEFVSLADVIDAEIGEGHQTTTAGEEGVYPVLVELSKYMTLKTGDVLCFPVSQLEKLPPAFTASINGSRVLNQRVK